MYLEQPSVVFIEIASELITANSGAGYELCQRVTGEALDRSTVCNTMGMGITDENFCFMMWNGSHDDNDADLDGARVVPTPEPTVDPGSNPSEGLKNAVAPQATNVPVRSAPHFNNDLFK